LNLTTYRDKHINHHPEEKKEMATRHGVVAAVLGMHFKRWK
tara:strand:+ start:60 stop:182 length:123 start_codon:yes stop_codon:yes gene_type:complete